MRYSQPVVIAIAVSCLALLSPASLDARIQRRPEPIRDQYIVVLKDIVAARELLPAVATRLSLLHHGRVLAVLSNGVKGFGVEMSAADAESLSGDSDVAWVEENAVGHLSYNVENYSNDTYWHLDRIDQGTTINPFMTKAYAWTSTGAGVAVYVVDSGVQAAHSEFNGNVVAGGNFALENGNIYPPDNPCGGFVNSYSVGHGTAVASLVAGQHVGVARGATIVAVKVATYYPDQPPGYGFQLTTLSLIQSLDWVLSDIQAHPLRRSVVTTSIFVNQGFDCGGTDCASALDNNVRNVVNAGAVFVASANNQNEDRCLTQSPARLGYGGMYDPGNQPSWPFVITVGGTDIADQRYHCDTCPLDPGSNFDACVDIYAPAKHIHAAHIASSNAYRDDPNWVAVFNQTADNLNQSQYDTTVDRVDSGTSFSAPIVAGIAARLLQTFPSMSVRDVWNFIHDSATALPTDFDGDGKYDNDRLVYISPYN